MAQRPHIGDILLQRGVLTRPQLDVALAHHRRMGLTVGRAAVVHGLCTEADVVHALSWQLGFQEVDLDRVEPAAEVSGLIPERIATQHRVVAVRLLGARNEVLVVAMAAPARLDAQDAVLAVAEKRRLQVLIAGDEAIDRAIARIYRGERGPRSGRTGERPAMALPPTESSPDPADEGPLAPIGLSPSTLGEVAQVAADLKLTPVELVRQMVDQWAERRRAERHSVGATPKR